jgi:hypothetical protein
MSLLMTIKGHNGQLELHDEKIVIKRKGLLAFSSQGLKGDKEIRIKSISAVQFKQAGMLVNGYIQFAHSGSSESKGGLFDAVKDENTVVFTKKQMPEFRELKDRLDDLINRLADAATAPAAAFSAADEIKKLAELRDQGLITSDQFEVKKQQLLGL